jgi:hypothetical protein
MPRRVPDTAVAGRRFNYENCQGVYLAIFSSQPANVRTANAVSALPQAASYSRKCLHFREIVAHMEYVSYDGLFQYTMVLLTVVGVVIAFMNIKKK